jgi:hypothetical protein
VSLRRRITLTLMKRFGLFAKAERVLLARSRDRPRVRRARRGRGIDRLNADCRPGLPP